MRNQAARCVVSALAFALSAPAFGEKVGATATVSVASGPHAGKYTLTSDDACVIAALDKNKPAGFSVVLLAPNASLSVDAPNIEANRINEAQVELVVADVKSGTSRKNTASTTYMLDTRPDASLERYQLEERGARGMSGKTTLNLSQQGTTARLQFAGQTASGVKLNGTIECRAVDREFGR